ncbi:MAG: WXG100 family type VII secretion target [Lachnospiraceae bacterium]|nr:WXG100 family type VII secretion target [Lachnospiraceae bacterium]
MKFEVYTDQVARLASSMESELAQVDELRQNMFRSMEDLDAMWEGSSHDAFAAQYFKDEQTVQELCNTITKLIEHIKEARKQYEQCEQSVKDMVNSIQI